MQVVLVSFRGEGERRSFSVVKESTIIGRREDCDLRIPVSEVSRKHCRIVNDGDQLRVEDLGSSNGTYHNGQRVQGGTVLNPGDSVQVGPVVFVVQIDGEPPEDELMPFKERAAHELDDSVAEASTAEALHHSDPGADEIEEHLDQLAAPIGEEDDLDSLELPSSGSEGSIPLDLEPSSGGHEAIPLDLQTPSGGHEPIPLDLELDEVPAGGEAGQGTEHGSAPIALAEEEEPGHEHAPSSPGGIDDEIDFSLIEEMDAAHAGSGAPIPLADDDHLEIPLEIEEEPHTPPKKPGR